MISRIIQVPLHPVLMGVRLLNTVVLAGGPADCVCCDSDGCCSSDEMTLRR